MARLPFFSLGASHVFFFQLFVYLIAARQFVLFGEWRHPSTLLFPSLPQRSRGPSSGNPFQSLFWISVFDTLTVCANHCDVSTNV
jgi:hypothetical protein